MNQIGFLSVRNASLKPGSSPINKILHEGMILPVEVIKDGKGDKNPQLKALPSEDFQPLTQGTCLQEPPDRLARLLKSASSKTSIKVHAQKNEAGLQMMTAAQSHGAEVEPHKENPFDAFNMGEALAGLTSDRISLPSGGWVTIEPTEALVAIDVNSGASHQPKNAA